MKKNTIDIGGDNNVVQVGHLGDVTVNQAPEPSLRVVSENHRTEADGTFTRIIRLEVQAPYPPGQLLIEAEADGMLGGDIHPVDIGMINFGQSQRTNAYYVEINHPVGRYDLVLRTPRRTETKLNYAFR